ncbi:Uncharacterised protein [Vibrio metschnikovii]|nr:Uncharacterised protein [Vibrio metschnikovii]SUQ10633.1 Uncharacterised protein [Vibrio metschnikovii]
MITQEKKRGASAVGHTLEAVNGGTGERLPTRCANSIFYTTLFTNSAQNYT